MSGVTWPRTDGRGHARSHCGRYRVEKSGSGYRVYSVIDLATERQLDGSTGRQTLRRAKQLADEHAVARVAA